MRAGSQTVKENNFFKRYRCFRRGQPALEDQESLVVRLRPGVLGVLASRVDRAFQQGRRQRGYRAHHACWTTRPCASTLRLGRRRDVDGTPGSRSSSSSRLSSVVIAKFHYTDPTRTGPDTDKVRAHCRRRAKFHYTDTDTDPTRTRHGQSPCTLSGTS